MATINDLSTIVQREVEDYAAGGSWKSAFYPISDVTRQIYTVMVVPDTPRPFPARAVVMARVIGDYVVIDEDTTDRPLVSELVRAGVPCEKIILLYAGQSLPVEAP